MLLHLNENVSRLRREHRCVGAYLYDKFDQTIARVEGLMVEPETYTLRYLVINFGGFLSIRGKRIALPAAVCEFADLGKVKTQWSQESMKDAPGNIEPLGRDDEERLLAYFDLDPYWTTKT